MVARNYAEALAATARRSGSVESFGALLDAVSGAIASDHKVLSVMVSPRVTKQAKKQVLERALEGIAPAVFVRFLQAVVQRGRQGLLPDISEAYQALVDQHLNRVHASVVTARPVEAAVAKAIAGRLSAVVGKTVLPHFRSEPLLVGGVTVRVGDQAFDGSLRRKLGVLRRRMLDVVAGGAQ